MTSDVISGEACLPRPASTLTRLSHVDECGAAPYCLSLAVKVDSIIRELTRC